MIAQTQTPRQRAAAREAARKAAPRPIGHSKLAAILASGGSVRRGTVLKSAFPQMEWQAFNSSGEFVAPIDWRIVARLSATFGPNCISEAKGVNR